MADFQPAKREFLTRTGALLATFGMAAVASDAGAAPVKTAVPLDYPGTGPIPWFRRIFHLYSGPDGLTRAEQLPVDTPEGLQAAQFLRRTAERVTIGGTSANAGYGFHVANQPTLLIPLFGTMIVELHDGTRYELQHGDIAIAEDCTGKGHISRAGANGSFMVAVQLPKPGCPATGSSRMTDFWTDAPAPAR
jgi:hypothetical protein